MWTTNRPHGRFSFDYMTTLSPAIQILHIVLALLAEHPLSPREAEIVRYVALGWSSGEIACSLGISTQTVKNHLRSVYRKTGAVNRQDLALLAVGRGWVELDLCYREAEGRARRNRTEQG
jgi:DNA-binding CsgD family transcriptional regulator